MMPAPSRLKPAINISWAGTPVNGSFGGRTTFTPSTVTTFVTTWFDGVVGVSVDRIVPELTIVSGGRPTVGSNDGVTIVTLNTRCRFAPAAMSPSCQVTVFVPLLKLVVHGPASVHLAEPATYAVPLGRTSWTTTFVWSSLPVVPATKVYVSVSPYDAVALSTCLTSVNAPVGTWWSVVQADASSLPTHCPSTNATLVSVAPSGASLSTVTAYVTEAVPGTVPPSPTVAAGTWTIHVTTDPLLVVKAGTAEPATSVTWSGSVSVMVRVAGALPVLVSVTV